MEKSVLVPPNVSFEKFLDRLFNKVGPGINEDKLIQSAAILSTVLEEKPRLKNLVLAQRGITELKLPEIVQIIENTIANTLHKQIITFNEKEYIITTILERCYLGKNANIEVGGGIIVRKTAKSILVTTFRGTIPSCNVVSFVDKFAETLPQ